MSTTAIFILMALVMSGMAFRVWRRKKRMQAPGVQSPETSKSKKNNPTVILVMVLGTMAIILGATLGPEIYRETASDGSAFTAHVTTYLSAVSLAKKPVGSTISVAYDPTDRSRVTLVPW